MSLIALSMLEKDGRALALSFAFAIGSIVFMIEVIRLFFSGVAAVISHIF
jgi:hypothetical protein